MIYVIGNAPESTKYTSGTFEEFLEWVVRKDVYGLDIETNVTPYYSTKKIITVQFGDEETQWLLQWSSLTEKQKDEVRKVLEDVRTVKVIHNGAFEGIVFRFHDIVIENVYDTMLAEKVLNGGLEMEDGYYALTGLMARYLYQYMSKEEQKTFGDDILTEAKVLYAVGDVAYLLPIRRMQMPELVEKDLDWVAALENEVLLSYVEMTYYGMELDKDKWRANIALAEPVIKQAEENLNVWLKQEPFYSKAEKLGYISAVDTVDISWSNHSHRTDLLTLNVPELPGGSLGVVKGFIKKNQDHPYIEMLKGYVDKDYTLLEQMVMNNHHDYLIEWEYLIPAGTPRINWNSTDQVLPLVQAVAPKLKNLNKKSLGDVAHPIFIDYKEYKDTLKLTSTYGESFIEKYVEPDGMVRTSFNQIVETGRVSTARPNMQNIPAKETVGNRYRNCFVPPKGWLVVDSDYSSQELCLTAYMASDPVWLGALWKGEDLHSVCAELVYGSKWKDAAEEDCAYYHHGHQKCKCKKHKPMRQNVKTINFGLIYGMSPMLLAATLRITLQEAKTLIELYFKTFPNIKRMLNALGAFGVKYGFSMTPAPFFRKRYYPEWRWNTDYVEAHIEQIEYNKALGRIERQSMNHPIQGGSADMMKLSTVLTRWEIRDNNLQDKVQIRCQVHDQLTTVAREDFAEEWSKRLDNKMAEAAKVFIPTGLLKAETNITTMWSK